MLYHPVADRLKEMITSGEIGKIYYIYTQRVNLGVIRQDENALLSFAPHDLSVILYLLDEEPVVVSAHGESYIQKGIEDVVFLSLRFADGKMANIHLSWLDPHKLRRVTIVGSKKMVVFDDMEASEKLKIYDKGVGSPSYNDLRGILEPAVRRYHHPEYQDGGASADGSGAFHRVHRVEEGTQDRRQGRAQGGQDPHGSPAVLDEEGIPGQRDRG